MQHLSLCWIATTTADSPEPSVKLSRIYISKPRSGDVKSTSFNNHQCLHRECEHCAIQNLEIHPAVDYQ